MTKLQEIAFPKFQFSKFAKANLLRPLLVGRVSGSQTWAPHLKLRSVVTELPGALIARGVMFSCGC